MFQPKSFDVYLYLRASIWFLNCFRMVDARMVGGEALFEWIIDVVVFGAATPPPLLLLLLN